MHILNGIWNFLQSWGIDLIVGLIILLFLWLGGKYGGVKLKAFVMKVKQIAWDFLAKEAVDYAEEYYYSKEGQVKKLAAINYMKSHSFLAKVFLNEKELDSLVQKAFDYLKSMREKNE